MSVEKICEYFNDIGILQLDEMNKFLKIYTQISKNKFKNKSDKIILALFSYITQISKNEKLLYETCKNIVNSFSNNQILHRYRAIYMINNIIKSKIYSRYISFFSKLIFFRNKKRANSKIIAPTLIKSNARNMAPNVCLNKENIDDINFTGRSKVINIIKKGKIVKSNSGNKKKLYYNNMKANTNENDNNNNNFRTYDYPENEKEYTFSPKINKNYKPKKNNKSNENINDEIDSTSLNNKSNFNKSNSNINKNISFKYSANYANNNKINDELEKMIENMSKLSGNPNNLKYIPKKTIYRRAFNHMYPNNSYKEMPFYSYPNINLDGSNDDPINNYYEEDYDFYQNEEDHIKKVQNKIFQLQLKKMDKISKECTFTPEINETPKYLLENKKIQNNLTDINYNYENNYKNCIYNVNNNFINNSFINSQSFSKKRKNKLTEEFSDDYYNVYPHKRKNRSKDSRSYSNSKAENKEFGIYKARKEKLMKQLKEKYPFMPSINENKNFQIKTTFDERQKKFIEDKRKKFQEKQEEELKQIEEMKKYYNKSKANIKVLVKKLYDEEAEKIKKRLQIEKEKSKKKKVIDWEKRNKKNKEKYPKEYKINYKPKNKQIIKNDLDKHVDDLIKNIQREKSYSSSKERKKNNSKKKNMNKKAKSKKDILQNNDDINKNKQLLLEKIKDEHIIGFKNNSTTNHNKYNFLNNDKMEKKEEDKKEEKKENLVNDNVYTLKESESLNLDNILSLSENKDYEKGHLLEGINKIEGIKSNAMQQIMNQLHNN